MRRAGTRREVSERITVTCDGASFVGWALNVSRGGVRAILEDKVELGKELDVEVGAEDSLKRRGRVVWVQEEPDGVIVGIEFIGGAAAAQAPSGTHESVPPAGDEEAPSGTVAKPETTEPAKE